MRESASLFVKRNRSWLEWLIPTILCAVMLGQLLFSVRQLSTLADEPTHLYSGYRYLKCNDLTFSAEHPPLAKIVAAAPLLFTDAPVDCTPFHGGDYLQSIIGLNWFYSVPTWPRNLMLARTVISVFAVVLCLLVWTVARRMFGLGTALVATLIVVFDPNLLAYGAMIMTDMAEAATFLLAIFAFYLWTRRRTTPLALCAGIATGLALLAKNSGIVLLPILFVLAVVDAFLPAEGKPRPWHRFLRNLPLLGAVFGIAFVVLWAGYGLRFSAHPGVLAVEPPSSLPSNIGLGRLFLRAESWHILPQAYLEGFASDPHSLLAVMARGVVNGKAHWTDLPKNLFYRCTVPFLTMAALSIIGMVCGFKRFSREYLFLLIPILIFSVGYMHNQWNAGMRHMLPLLPLLIILTAAGCVELARRWSWVAYPVCLLLVLHAASSLRAFPNYISYANEIAGGPKQAYKLLGSPDGGQSYIEVRKYREAHALRDCILIANVQYDPEEYGVHCDDYGLFLSRVVPSRIHGTVIVSSALLAQGHSGEQAMLSDAFRNLTPVDYIGGSAMLVFKGDFDTHLATMATRQEKAEGTCERVPTRSHGQYAESAVLQ